MLHEVGSTQQRRPQVCLLLASSVSDVVARGRISVSLRVFVSFLPEELCQYQRVVLARGRDERQSGGRFRTGVWAGGAGLDGMIHRPRRRKVAEEEPPRLMAQRMSTRVGVGFGCTAPHLKLDLAMLWFRQVGRLGTRSRLRITGCGQAGGEGHSDLVAVLFEVSLYCSIPYCRQRLGVLRDGSRHVDNDGAVEGTEEL